MQYYFYGIDISSFMTTMTVIQNYTCQYGVIPSLSMSSASMTFCKVQASVVECPLLGLSVINLQLESSLHFWQELYASAMSFSAEFPEGIGHLHGMMLPHSEITMYLVILGYITWDYINVLLLIH